MKVSDLINNDEESMVDEVPLNPQKVIDQDISPSTSASPTVISHPKIPEVFPIEITQLWTKVSFTPKQS